MHRFGAAWLALCVALGLVLTSLQAPLSAEDPFDLNVITSLTGSLAFAGHDEADVLGVLEKVVNRQGGVRGRPIHFVLQDDQSNAVIALQLANDLVAKNAPVILGPTDVSTCNAIAPQLTNGPVLYCFAPSVHPPDGSYMFSSSISSADFIASNVRFSRLHGWTKLAVAVTANSTGQDGERGVDEAVALPENRGIVSVVDREHFAPTDLSVDAEIARIKASGAQALIVYVVGTPLGTLLRSAYQAGLTIPIFAPAANFNYKQLGGYAGFPPANLYMALAAYAAPSRLPKGPLQTVVRTYLDGLHSANILPAQPQIAAWDPASITVAAFRALGTGATAAQIRAYIANLHDWTGIEGTYDFRKIPQRGIGADWLFICHWDPTKQTMTPVSKEGGVPL